MVNFLCGVCNAELEGAKAFIIHHSLHSSKANNWLLCRQAGCFTVSNSLKIFREHIRKHERFCTRGKPY